MSSRYFIFLLISFFNGWLLPNQSSYLHPSKIENTSSITLAHEYGFGGITTFEWLPDGHQLLVGNSTGIWSYDVTGSNKTPRRLEGYIGNAQKISLSPNGTLVAVQGDLFDTQVHILNIQTGQLVQTLNDLSSSAPIVFRADEETFITVNDQGIIQLRNVFSGAVEALFGGQKMSVLAISPNGKTLVRSLLMDDQNSWNTELWDIATETRQAVIEKKLSHIVFSPDGKKFSVTLDDHHIEVYATETGDLLQNLQIENTDIIEPRFTPRLTGIDFSPDAAFLVTASDAGVVRLWNLASGRFDVVGYLDDDYGGIYSYELHIAVSPNGKVVALGDSSSLFLDDVSKNGITSMLIDHDFPVCDVDFSADDRLLFGYSPGDAVQVWNVQTGARLGLRRNFWLRFQETPVRWRCLGNSFAIHPKGHITATAGESDISSVSVTNEYSTTFFEGHEQIVQSVTFSPDGLLLASGSEDKTIRLWEMASGKQLAVIKGHEAGIQVLYFSRDSAWLSSGDANGEVRLWDATTGKSIGKPMRGSSAAVSSLAFNPDKTQLISGDTAGFLYLWNIATGDLLTSIPAHMTGVRRIVFSSSGNLFVSIGESAKLWNIVTRGG